MARLIKAFWFFSLLAGLVVLLYVYAGLPGNVVYALNELGNQEASVSRDTFFYISLAALVIANFSLYTVSRSLHYRKETTNQLMVNWQLSLAGVFNIFFIVVWGFISLINSGETFNYDYFGYLIYISIGLIFIWIVALPILLIRHLNSSKDS